MYSVHNHPPTAATIEPQSVHKFSIHCELSSADCLSRSMYSLQVLSLQPKFWYLVQDKGVRGLLCLFHGTRTRAEESHGKSVGRNLHARNTSFSHEQQNTEAKSLAMVPSDVIMPRARNCQKIAGTLSTPSLFLKTCAWRIACIHSFTVKKTTTNTNDKRDVKAVRRSLCIEFDEQM